MAKTNIMVHPQECKECLYCQLLCSLTYEGALNPEKAKIVIDPPKEISFTDDCIENCILCARYCPFGALEISRQQA